MFKIGEFSRLTRVSVRMLRYYDENGLLKPAQVDPWTGYRLYAAEQVALLNKIVYLRDSGFQVAEIAAALKGGDQATLSLLEGKRAQIEASMAADRERLRKLQVAKAALEGGGGDGHYQITVKAVPACLALCLRRVIPTYFDEGTLWQALSAFARDSGADLSGDSFSIYHDPDYRERDVDVEVCAQIGSAHPGAGEFRCRLIEAVPRMACAMVPGDFSRIAGAYRSFAGWLEDSGCRMGPTSRQIVHRGPWNESDPENYLTEMQIPLDSDTV